MEKELNNNFDGQHDRVIREEFLPQINALYDFAYKLVRNEADANDLVQETYLKAVRSVHTYTPGSNAKAWMFMVAKNLFINDYRKRKNRPAQVDYDEIVTYAREGQICGDTSTTDLREDIFALGLSDEVEFALSRLDQNFLEVITLDLQDYTYEEISDFVQIPIGTVRSRIFRGRNALKANLVAFAADNYGIEDKRG